MSWVEENGPPVTSPGRKGFGQLVIGRMVEAAVDGTTAIEYMLGGFSWNLLAPIGDVLEPATLDGAKVRSQ